MRVYWIFAVASWLWGASLCAGQEARFVPRDKLPPEQSSDGKALLYQTPLVNIRAEFLDAEERMRFILARLGKSARDPFALDTEGRPLFLTALVQIENRSNSRMYFNPGTAELRGGGEDYPPVSYTLLYTYMETFTDDRTLIDGLMSVVYESSEILRPGEKTSKLLVFSEFPSGGKLTLTLGPIDLGIDLRASSGNIRKVEFKFVEFEKSEKKRKP